MTIKLVAGDTHMDGTESITFVLAREPTPSDIFQRSDIAKLVLSQLVPHPENIEYAMTMCSINKCFREQAKLTFTDIRWTKMKAFNASADVFALSIPELCRTAQWNAISAGLLMYKIIPTVCTRSCLALLLFLNQHDIQVNPVQHTVDFKNIVGPILQIIEIYTTQCKIWARRSVNESSKASRVTARGNAQIAACKLLIKMYQDGTFGPMTIENNLVATVTRVIIGLMRQHPLSIEVQVVCCQVLEFSVLPYCLEHEACIPLAVAAMRAHTTDVHVCKAVCRLLCRTRFQEQYAQYKKPAVCLVISAMRVHSDMAVSGCEILQVLSVQCSVGQRLVFEAGGMACVHDVMRRGAGDDVMRRGAGDDVDESLTLSAITAMYYIARYNEEAKSTVVDCIPLVLDAMSRNMSQCITQGCRLICEGYYCNKSAHLAISSKAHVHTLCELGLRENLAEEDKTCVWKTIGKAVAQCGREHEIPISNTNLLLVLVAAAIHPNAIGEEGFFHVQSVSAMEAIHDIVRGNPHNMSAVRAASEGGIFVESLLNVMEQWLHVLQAWLVECIDSDDERIREGPDRQTQRAQEYERALLLLCRAMDLLSYMCDPECLRPFVPRIAQLVVGIMQEVNEIHYGGCEEELICCGCRLLDTLSVDSVGAMQVEAVGAIPVILKSIASIRLFKEQDEDCSDNEHSTLTHSCSVLQRTVWRGEETEKLTHCAPVQAVHALYSLLLVSQRCIDTGDNKNCIVDQCLEKLVDLLQDDSTPQQYAKLEQFYSAVASNMQQIITIIRGYEFSSISASWEAEFEKRAETFVTAAMSINTNVHFDAVRFKYLLIYMLSTMVPRLNATLAE